MYIFLPRLLLVMDCRSCSETSKQAHTIMQDSERRHAGSSNNFICKLYLQLQYCLLGTMTKKPKYHRILQTCSIRNSTQFQLLASDKPEMAFSFNWPPGRLQFGLFFVVVWVVFIFCCCCGFFVFVCLFCCCCCFGFVVLFCFFPLSTMF